MSVKMKAKPRNRKPGTVPIRLDVSPDDRAMIRKAAALHGCQSMAEFAAMFVIDSARKVLRHHGLEQDEKKS